MLFQLSQFDDFEARLINLLLGYSRRFDLAEELREFPTQQVRLAMKRKETGKIDSQ